LRDGLDALEALRQRAGRLRAGTPERLEWATNLRFMLPTAETILRCALMRRESRGAHFREDFPEPDTEWEQNILCSRDPGGEWRMWTEPVPPVTPTIRAALDEEHELDYHHLE
jgi:succinate dehydrogenase / fumarate reductase, flavoprotein subunit